MGFSAESRSLQSLDSLFFLLESCQISSSIRFLAGDGRADYWCVGLTLGGKDGKLCSDITTKVGEVDMRMGLREANQSFSKAIKAVKQGKEVVLTERGKPIAVIKPLDPKEDQEAMIWRLEAEGILRPALKRGPMPKPSWKPIRVKGKLMSQTISEERDER
jgi:prevent-host-death family protein